MTLYPTETIYGLGVNVLDDAALAALFQLKGRDERQTVSWGVRDLADIETYAEVSETARRLVEAFLPGPLTLVLPAAANVPLDRQAPDRTVGFRIPGDAVAQQTIADFMATHGAPLTCTSANVSGEAVPETPAAILEQFTAAGRDTSVITQVVDDGPRYGVPSTVVRVVGEDITVHREGAISAAAISHAAHNPQS